MAELSTQRNTAAFVVTHLRPTLRPGNSPLWNRLYTVSGETVRNCAAIATSRMSGTLAGNGWRLFLPVLLGTDASVFAVVRG